MMVELINDIKAAQNNREPDIEPFLFFLFTVILVYLLFKNMC